MSQYQQERFPFPSPSRLRRELRLPRPPLWLVGSLVALFIPAGMTLALIYRARHTPSTRPRVQLFQDMGVQPRYGTQASSPVFADGRSARPPVGGTLARGQLQDKPHFDRGWEMTLAASSGQSTVVYFKGLPPEVSNTPALRARGRIEFGIYCAVCHGALGDGHGPVNDTVVRNKEPKWIPAPSLRTPNVGSMPDGQLYHVIRSGIRSMPPYGAQIDVADRWAIVAYVRTLSPQQATPALTGPARAPATRSSP